MPGRYRYFRIYEPKERTISVADFRDRVVHHAVVSVLEPIYEKRFIYDSYATRKNKGTHRAVRRAQKFMKSGRYFLKFDIDKYFDNIDHDTLLEIIGRKVKDSELMRLLRIIVENNDLSRQSRDRMGLPIGNLTSQFFANVYLDIFDHYMKDRLGVKRYIRYMDDCVIFDPDKDVLKVLLYKSECFLKDMLGLKLKASVTMINSRISGLPFLGYRVFPSLLRVRQENIRRLKRKMHIRQQEYADGRIDESRYSMSLASMAGYAGFADSLNLRRDIFITGSGQKAGLTG